MKIAAAYPMLEMQRGIAYECELYLENEVYISQAIIKLNYDNLTNYKKAWQHVVNKYEIFKTKFVFGDLKDDVQIVLNEGELIWKEENWLQSELKEKAEKEKVLQLAKYPLMKFSQVNTGNETYLIWTFHHILLDGWSMSLTLQEVDRVYDCLQHGEQLSEGKDTLYSEYVAWKLTNEKPNKQAFWKKYLSNFKGFDFPEIAKKSSSVQFNERMYESKVKVTTLMEYCKKQQVSPAVFFQAVWASILGIYSGKTDILFEVIDSGRSQNATVDLERVVGLMIENHPKRVQLSLEQTFEELLEKIKADDLEIRMYDSFSTSQGKKVLGMSTADVYSNSTFVFENYPNSEQTLRFDMISGSEMSTSDLTFSAGIVGSSISMKLMFSTLVIDSLQAETILQQIDRWIETIVNSDQKNDMTTLTEQIPLSIAQGVEAPFPKDQTFFDCLSKVSEETPKKIAIYDGKKEVTYETLVRKTKDVIIALEQLEIKSGESVGIYLPRSAESIIMMCALQYLNIPYIYLDDKNTQDRLEYIVQDANINVLLKGDRSLDLKEFPFIRQIDVSELFKPNVKNERILRTGTTTASFCQLIYTSGSSGKPKGIEMTANNILSFVFNNGFYVVQSTENFAQAASMAFDASIFEIWLPLLNGASVTIIPDPVFDIYNWHKAVTERKVTTAWLTSGLFNTFTDLDFSLLNQLKKVYVGGEVVSPSHVEKAMSAAPRTRFFNGYGPTENTTFTTTFEIRRGFDSTKPLPIGQLLGNSAALVVDENNLPVPLGVAGELIISGSGLTNGYHNNKELTDFAFIEIKLPMNNQAQLAYHTGDIVYYDGENFHYVGRKDDQIKLRGFRIELGEIEYILTQLKEVEQAAVVLETMNDQVKEIKAFYVGAVDEKDVAKLLTDKLPSYMMPKHFHKVDTIPLTVNGKVDKRLLLSNINQTETMVAKNEIEAIFLEKVEEVFAKYISFETLSLDAELFDYGIDSLTAVKLNHELNKKLNKDVSLRQFIESETFGQLLLLYSEESIEKQIIEMEELNSEKKSFEKLAKATEMQKSMYYFQSENPELSMYNIPFVNEFKREEIDANQIKQRYLTIVSKNPVFQSYLKEDEAGLLSWFKRTEGLQTIYEYHVTTAEERDLLIKQGLNYSFDLKSVNESLVRLTLVYFQDSIWLVLMLHHTIADGSSMEILLNELLGQNEIISKKVNYFDYLNQYDEQDQQKNLEYWKQALEDIQPAINFSKNSDFYFDHRGSMLNMPLSKELIGKLNLISNETKISKYILSLTLYSQFLMSYYNQKSIVVGTPVSTRPNDYQDVYGMYLSFLPYVSKKDDNKIFKEFLIENKYSLFDMMDHTGVEYHELEKITGTNNSSDGLSFIQTVFNYQDLSIEEKGSVKDAAVIAADHQSAQFPLTVTFYETQEDSFIQVEYSTGLFKETQIKDLMTMFSQWLANGLASLDSPLSLLSVYTEKQGNNLVHQLNPNFKIRKQPLATYLTAISLDNHELAIVDGDVTFTYAQIFEKVNSFADKLRASGLQKGDQLVFFGQRSWQQVVLFYTCLIHGFVYIPIDAKHSQSRLDQVIEEVHPALIFYSDVSLASKVKNGCLIENMFTDVRFPVSTNRVKNQIEDLAYILFTSGTTGKPKGVQISQRNLANFAAAFTEDYQIKQHWRTAFISSISFDASIMDMMATVVLGNTLCIFNDEHQFLADYIKTLKINFLIITPTLFNVLDFTSCDSLELIISGGDKFRANRTLSPNTRVINGYGPTEATVCISFTDTDQELTVGRPVSNSCVMILDDHLNVLPQGSQGEICVLGPSVTESYLAIEDNQNRLLQAPKYLAEFGEKVYKTGDIGYFDESGKLHYLGRNDNQVKIRGHRVELSEISERASQFSSIKEAYTKLIVEENTGSSKIVLYVTIEGKTTLIEEELKGFLYEFLPTYMIPDAIVQIEAFNLTVNGKINTKDLPLPTFKKPMGQQIAAANELEELLLSIWKQVFQTNEISVVDNYYDIGGDSIKSIQIVSKLREHKIQLSIKEIMDYQSIRGIAKHIHQIENMNDMEVKGTQLTEFPITPIQQWFYRLQLPNENYWNQSNLLTIKVNDPEINIREVIQKIYLQHPMLRAKIVNTTRGQVVKIIPMNELDFSEIIQVCATKQALNERKEQLQKSLNIENGPTSKLAYYRENGEVVIYWVSHHLFIDVYSWEIIQKELIEYIEDKNKINDDLDLMTDEYVIQHTSEQADKFDVVKNEENQLYCKKNDVEVFTLKIDKLNSEQTINLALLFSSLFFENILKTTNGALAVYREENARFTESFKRFDISRSVGWLTEFDHHFIKKDDSHEQIYAALTSKAENLRSVAPTQAVFLNIVSLGQNMIQQENGPSDIASENMKSMPPMLNIISDSEGLSISILNIDHSFELYQQTIEQLKVLLEQEFLSDYYQYIQSTEQAIVTLKEYQELKKDSDVETIYPLFPLQEDIIYSSSGAFGSYMNDFCWTTVTPVDEVIARFNNVVKKYEALRTVIRRTSADQFVQLIYDKNKPFSYQFYDLREQSTLKQKESIAKLINSNQQTYQMEENKYLHGLYLFQLDEQQTRVVWLFNHLIVDGWSVGLIIKELWGEETEENGSTSNLEYVRWLLSKQTETADAAENGIEVDGKLGRLFENDMRFNLTGTKNLEMKFELSDELSEKINDYTRKRQVTSANLMNTVWGYILSRMTNAETVVFGMVDSGRNCPVENIESKVGLFIRTIASIFKLDSNQKISTFIQEQSRKVTAQLYNGELSIFELRKGLKLTPKDELYETLLVVENYPEPSVDLDEISDVEANEQSNYLLSLSVGLEEKLIYKVAYNPEVMNESSIVIIGQWIEVILQSIIENDNELVATLPDWSNKVQIGLPVSVREIEASDVLTLAKNGDQIRAVWENVLGHTNFSETDDFFEIGGDSLKLSKMIFLLREDYGYELDVLKFFENPTLQLLQNSKDFDSSTQEHGEQEEAISQPPIYLGSLIDNNKVLVTGATGLLGSELVYQTLKQGKEVYCIVRGKDQLRATQRVITKLEEIVPVEEQLRLEKLHVFNGDVSKESFALSAMDYQRLALEVSVIYHCAGNVNFMASMKDACDVNVGGIANVMAFAQKARLKKVNHVSTLSVVGHDHYVIEDIDLAPISYVKSKVLAEHYLRNYREVREGLLVSRVGRIAGNSRTFVVPEQDLFWRLLVSIAQLGCCPDEFLPFETDLTPVDFIVEELIKRTEASNDNQVMNYFSKCMISFGRCIEILERVLKRKIMVVSYEEWLERAEYDAKDNQIKVLVPLFRENVFYEPEESSIITESSPDQSIQVDLSINKEITDEVVECYLKNILDQMKIY